MKLQKTKLLLKFLIIAVPLALINIMYLKSDYRSDTLKFKYIPDNIQIANTGSSHEELGINYAVLPKDIVPFNFALGAQTFLYDNHILDEYISHFAPDSVLLIAVSKTSLTSKMTAETLNSYKYRYNQFLSRENIENFTLNDYIIDRYFPVFSSKHPFKKVGETAKNILKKIKRKYIPAKQSKKEKIINAVKENLTFADKIEFEKKNQVLWKIKDWARLFPYAGEEGFQENLFYVKKILEKCEAHKVNPVLLSLPITEAMSSDFEQVYQAFTPERRTTEDDYKRFIDEIKKDYPNVTVLDYSNDTDFTKNYIYFSDVDHLNEVGSKVFSAKLFKDLEKLNLLKLGE